ncbi:MAG: L-seryl-tRNA(Sec) selenium transferase [Gemmatimonadota bacterium]
MTDPRRHLPGVDVLLASPAFQPLLANHPRGRVVEAVRDVLVTVREEIGRRGEGAVPSHEAGWAARVQELLLVRDLPSLRGVINATGVVLHTNLGRAPLSKAARAAMAAAGRGYSNLEFDLEGGERGSRYVHCVDLLRELTGAGDALVVNNNAAAVVLGLNTIAAGHEVLVSRGELVEIGGGFRIPDMLSRSGAVLREVGTTNRTRIEDYREAAEQGPVTAILKVHRSNFRISGFTEEASIRELGELARELGLILFHDLGSGLLADPEALGLPFEPRVPESLRGGAHAVAVSGDKLLGGPQAGIILGEADLIGAMRKNPLCRAFRVDKVTLAGLEATLRHYLDPEEALREIPALRMLAMPIAEIETRAHALAGGLEAGGFRVRVTQGSGVVGGGTFPGVELPSWTIRVKGPEQSPRELAHRLRTQVPPLVARVENDELVLDLRTVDREDDHLVLSALRGALGARG